jgi:hypothetical protein
MSRQQTRCIFRLLVHKREVLQSPKGEADQNSSKTNERHWIESLFVGAEEGKVEGQHGKRQKKCIGESRKNRS